MALLVQIKVEGRPFHCPCGGNVFRQVNSRVYICNACEAYFKGVGKPDKSRVEDVVNG